MRTLTFADVPNSFYDFNLVHAWLSRLVLLLLFAKKLLLEMLK